MPPQARSAQSTHNAHAHAQVRACLHAHTARTHARTSRNPSLHAEAASSLCMLTHTKSASMCARPYASQDVHKAHCQAVSKAVTKLHAPETHTQTTTQLMHALGTRTRLQAQDTHTYTQTSTQLLLASGACTRSTTRRHMCPRLTRSAPSSTGSGLGLNAYFRSMPSTTRWARMNAARVRVRVRVCVCAYMCVYKRVGHMGMNIALKHALGLDECCMHACLCTSRQVTRA